MYFCYYVSRLVVEEWGIEKCFFLVNMIFKICGIIYIILIVWKNSLLYIVDVCSNYSVWKVLLYFYIFLFFGRKFFFKIIVFLVDYLKFVY